MKGKKTTFVSLVTAPATKQASTGVPSRLQSLGHAMVAVSFLFSHFYISLFSRSVQWSCFLFPLIGFSLGSFSFLLVWTWRPLLRLHSSRPVPTSFFSVWLALLDLLFTCFPCFLCRFSVVSLGTGGRGLFFPCFV